MSPFKGTERDREFSQRGESEGTTERVRENEKAQTSDEESCDSPVCWMRREKDVRENEGESERETVVEKETQRALVLEGARAGTTERENTTEGGRRELGEGGRGKTQRAGTTEGVMSAGEGRGERGIQREGKGAGGRRRGALARGLETTEFVPTDQC